MKKAIRLVSRRDFLKLAGLGLGAAAWGTLPPAFRVETRRSDLVLPEFPHFDRLGRNCTADTSLQWGGTIPILAQPDVNGTKVRDATRDEVFPWLREVSSPTVDYNRINQRWVETPEGFIYAPYLQPCRNLPNTPLTALPEGKAGFWAEVTVPYVDLILDNPNPVSGWMKDHVAYGIQPRLHYLQVMWIDAIRTSASGAVQYHVNERYANPGDLFWADGAAFRPISEDEISPLHPDVDPAVKKIVVNLNYQTLSCQEDNREVYFCRVSTGAQSGSTPLGNFAIWRKLISVRMAAGTTEASYDLPGIPWTTLFIGNGVAIHGTTTHNDFGFPRSHGCVNCLPGDAKWIFRWCQPSVPLEPGEVTWQDWIKGSTHVIVENPL